MFSNQSFIIDEKYEKKCQKILKKNEKKLNSKKGIFTLAVTGSLATAAVAWLLINQKPEMDLYNNFINNKKQSLEDEEQNSNHFQVEKNRINTKILEQMALEKEIVSTVTTTELTLELYYRNFQYDSYIKQYCGYFLLDYPKVIELARSETNNYEDFSKFLTEEDCDLTNKEAVCMQFVCLLYKDINYTNKNKTLIDWENSLYTKEEVSHEGIVTIPYNNLNELYLHGDLKYSEYLGKTCDMFNINDKILALSVSIEEVGKKGSRLSKELNNFGGLRINEEWMSFPSPEAGIIYFCGTFKKYNKYTLNNLDEMANIYVGKSSPVQEKIDWVLKVKDYYKEIQDNYDDYFLGSHDLEDDENQNYVLQLAMSQSKTL